jgi:hypothetical protein
MICSTVKRPETQQDWRKEKSTCQLIDPSEHMLLKAQNLQNETEKSFYNFFKKLLSEEREI